MIQHDEMVCTSQTYQHAIVHDLAWVMQSPAIVDVAQYLALVPQLNLPVTHVSIVTDEYCLALTQQHQVWLQRLDQDPLHLQQWLVERSSHRLGYYFETLVEYWLHHLYQDGFVTTHVQVQRDKQTLGEFDFLFAAAQAERLQHWEVAIKFYLYHPSASGVERWYGPLTRDRLDLKLAHLLQHQIALSQCPEGRSKLAQLGYHTTESSIFLKGYLFYPSRSDWQFAPHHNPGVAAGHLRGWWSPIEPFNVPQQSADSHWAVIPRLRWLSPLILAEAEIDTLIARADLWQYCRAHMAKSPEPFLIAEMVPASDGHWHEITRGFIVNEGWPMLESKQRQ